MIYVKMLIYSRRSNSSHIEDLDDLDRLPDARATILDRFSAALDAHGFVYAGKCNINNVIQCLALNGKHPSPLSVTPREHGHQ